MVLYNEQIPKMSCQSSVVVIEHHINTWLGEDCCTLTILKPDAKASQLKTLLCKCARVARVAFARPARG